MFLSQFEVRKPVELPLWGNIVVLVFVAVLVGIIVRDLIKLRRLNKEGK